MSHITPNREFFTFIYERLVHKYNENPNFDYMQSFKERIDELFPEDNGIVKGNYYTCTKDYYETYDGGKALRYKKDKVYFSQKDGCIMDEWGTDGKEWKLDEWTEYFTPCTEGEIDEQPDFLVIQKDSNFEVRCSNLSEFQKKIIVSIIDSWRYE